MTFEQHLKKLEAIQSDPNLTQAQKDRLWHVANFQYSRGIK